MYPISSLIKVDVVIENCKRTHSKKMKHLFNVIVKEIVRSICLLCLFEKEMATLVDVDGIYFIRIFLHSEIIVAIVSIQSNAAAAADNPTLRKLLLSYTSICISKLVHRTIDSSLELLYLSI